MTMLDRSAINRAIPRQARYCEDCRFFSDLQARVNQRGNIMAKCLCASSITHGEWRPEDGTCYSFERGPSIDLEDSE
jgi:hypothetical protein